jgi:hypothetical protein
MLSNTVGIVVDASAGVLFISVMSLVVVHCVVVPVHSL